MLHGLNAPPRGKPLATTTTTDLATTATARDTVQAILLLGLMTKLASHALLESITVNMATGPGPLMPGGDYISAHSMQCQCQSENWWCSWNLETGLVRHGQ